MLASLKEDRGTVDINAVVNDMLDPSENAADAAEKTSSCPDSGSQDESLTRVFVRCKEKAPAITENIAGLIDIAWPLEVFHQTNCERTNFCQPQQLTRKSGICYHGIAEQLTSHSNGYKSRSFKVFS